MSINKQDTTKRGDIATPGSSHKFLKEGQTTKRNSILNNSELEFGDITAINRRKRKNKKKKKNEDDSESSVSNEEVAEAAKVFEENEETIDESLK